MMTDDAAHLLLNLMEDLPQSGEDSDLISIGASDELGLSDESRRWKSVEKTIENEP